MDTGTSTCPDERAVAQLLVLLAVGEPGENWRDEKFEGRLFELPAPWVSAVPTAGRLSLIYYSSDKSVVPELREACASHCLVGEAARSPPTVLATALQWAGGRPNSQQECPEAVTKLLAGCWLASVNGSGSS